jgi:hypothetical protein
VTIQPPTHEITIAYAHALASVNCRNTTRENVRVCMGSFHCDCLRQARAAAEESTRILEEAAIASTIEDQLNAEEDAATDAAREKG